MSKIFKLLKRLAFLSSSFQKKCCKTFSCLTDLRELLTKQNACWWLNFWGFPHLAMICLLFELHFTLCQQFCFEWSNQRNYMVPLKTSGEFYFKENWIGKRRYDTIFKKPRHTWYTSLSHCGPLHTYTMLRENTFLKTAVEENHLTKLSYTAQLCGISYILT